MELICGLKNVSYSGLGGKKNPIRLDFGVSKMIQLKSFDLGTLWTHNDS